MDRLGKQEWPGASDQFRKQRFMAAITDAIQSDNLPSLRWWLTTYLPDHAFAVPKLRKLAVEAKCEHYASRRVEILQWLLDQGKLANRESAFKILIELGASSKTIVLWLHENVPGIQMNFELTCESCEDFIKWAYEHSDRYGVSHASAS